MCVLQLRQCFPCAFSEVLGQQSAHPYAYDIPQTTIQEKSVAYLNEVAAGCLGRAARLQFLPSQVDAAHSHLLQHRNAPESLRECCERRNLDSSCHISCQVQAPQPAKAGQVLADGDHLRLSEIYFEDERREGCV